MQILPISDTKDAIIEFIYQHYIQTFPPDERRNKKQFLDLLNHTHATVNIIQFQSNDVGYIILWKLAQGIFIEHFEIFPLHRNQKLGEKVLNHLKLTYKTVILETEPEGFSDMADRRIRFYKRNRFYIINEQHTQPAYEAGKQDLTMYLMSSNTDIDLVNVQKEIGQTVYRL